MKPTFLSGDANRSLKIETAFRKLLVYGWTKEEISDSFYNIGIDRKDTANALAVIESEALEADLQQAAEAART
jgi:hypothetical protein